MFRTRVHVPGPVQAFRWPVTVRLALGLSQSSAGRSGLEWRACLCLCLALSRASVVGTVRTGLSRAQTAGFKGLFGRVCALDRPRNGLGRAQSRSNGRERVLPVNAAVKSGNERYRPSQSFERTGNAAVTSGNGRYRASTGPSAGRLVGRSFEPVRRQEWIPSDSCRSAPVSSGNGRFEFGMAVEWHRNGAGEYGSPFVCNYGDPPLPRFERGRSGTRPSSACSDSSRRVRQFYDRPPLYPYSTRHLYPLPNIAKPNLSQ